MVVDQPIQSDVSSPLIPKAVDSLDYQGRVHTLTTHAHTYQTWEHNNQSREREGCVCCGVSRLCQGFLDSGTSQSSQHWREYGK